MHGVDADIYKQFVEILHEDLWLEEMLKARAWNRMPQR